MVYLKPGDARFEEGLNYIADRMAAAIQAGRKFVIASLGGSVTAAHNNCNYDSYQRQLERTMQPVWDAAGIAFEVRNAGQGGGCGDDFRNQIFCVRHIGGDDADIIHYSWTYFEAGKDYNYVVGFRESLLRWALSMPKAPPLHIINVNDLRADSQCASAVCPAQMFEMYGKYGGNIVCPQTSLLRHTSWNGVQWGVIGDGLHTTTRYGNEPGVSAARRDSLGVMFRNWHPGPLGFQAVADAFAHYYARAMVRAVERLEQSKARTVGPISAATLGAPYTCDVEMCSIPAPPSCVYFERPAYGEAQVRMEPTSSWEQWVAPPSSQIPAEEQSMPECAHFDHCGSMKPKTPVSSDWITFTIPAGLTLGRVFLCCCCGQKCVQAAFYDTAAEFMIDGALLPSAQFETWPVNHGRPENGDFGGKCLKIQDRWGSGGVHGEMQLKVPQVCMHDEDKHHLRRRQRRRRQQDDNDDDECDVTTVMAMNC